MIKTRDFIPLKKELSYRQMTRPNPIAIIVLSIVAISILAFTINDQFRNKGATATSLIKKTENKSLFATTNPPHGQPGHRHDLGDGAPLPDVTTSAAQAPLAKINLPTDNNVVPQLTENNTTTSGKNPEHGKPGHRCDIAVGAPLYTEPAKATYTTTPGVTTTPASTTPTTSTPKISKGLNPAHGQPGHRCDIAVGAPLNSSPAKPNTTATTTPLNSSVFPKYDFGKTDSAAVATPQFQYDSTGAALNPAHGQPGHDCAIAVGKPLKKK